MLNLTAAGRLGKDAELRTTQAGEAVLGFSIAVDQGYGDKKKTQWVECSIWGKRGEKLAQYLTKGAIVVVSGECSLREWESKTASGVSLSMRVDQITLLGGKSDGKKSSGEERAPAGGSDWTPPADLDDEIPFATRTDFTDALIGMKS